MPTNGVNSQFFPSPQMVKASFADSKTSGLPDRPAQRKLVADEVPPVVIHAEEPGSVVARPSKVALTELVDSGDLGKLRTNFSNHLGKLDRRTASAQEKESLAANKRFCSDNEPALRTGIGNFGGRLSQSGGEQRALLGLGKSLNAIDEVRALRRSLSSSLGPPRVCRPSIPIGKSHGRNAPLRKQGT